MAEVVGVTRVACNTGTGNQAITVGCDGETPVAAIFIISGATSDATATDHARIGFGMTDGSNHFVMATTSEHGVSTSDNFRHNANDTVIAILETGDANVDGEATFVSFAADSVTINWTDAPASAYLLTVIAFAGSGVSAKVGVADVVTSKDSSTHIEDVGFEADCIFAISTGTDDIPDASSPGCYLAIGWAVNDVGTTQGCLAWRMVDNRTTTTQHTILSNSYVGGHCDYTDPDWVYANEITDIDSDGFNLYTREDDAPSDVDMAYLALKFDNADVHLETIDTETGTGTKAYTNPGFTPQALITIASNLESVDTRVTNNQAGMMGMGVASGTSTEYSSLMTTDDNVSTTDTESYSDDQALLVKNDDGTLHVAASLDSFDANGYTLDYGTVDSSAHKVMVLAIEAEAAAGVTVPLMDHHYRTRRAA